MVPNEEVLMDNLGKIAYTLDKAYISQLTSDFTSLYFDQYNISREDNDKKVEQITYPSNIRALQVRKWVLDKNEKVGDSFKNVLSLFADGDHTVALVIKRTVQAAELYFVVKNEGAGRNEDSVNNIELLKKSIEGNFPGTDIAIEEESLNKPDKIEALFGFKDYKSIAALVNTPSAYSEDYVTQGLDKLLNGIVPGKKEEEYAVIFMAESLPQSDIREILTGYEDMATAMHPFLTYQFQAGSSKMDTQGEMQSLANTESITNSTFKSHSINVGVNGVIGRNSGTSKGGVAQAVLSGGGMVLGGVIGGLASGGVGIGAGAVAGQKVGQLIGSALPMKTQQNGTNVGIGGNLGYGYSWGSSKGEQEGKVDTKGSNSSISLGDSETSSYTYKSYLVENLMGKIQKTMKRIEESQSTGLWKFSTYVLSQEASISKSVANYVRALTQGKESYVESAAIQEWSKKGGNEKSEFDEIKKFITHFSHPVFITSNEEVLVRDAMMVTPTSYVSTDELAHVMVLPRKSLPNLPVFECVPFGREPHSLTPITVDLELGDAYHMRKVVPSQRVGISKEKLTMHTFITGSTGTGKSNTVYQILDRVKDKDTKFLVIEPAKGEYKNVFGGCDKVRVYGTNPNKATLLRLNPFSFPEDIHVLEHIDRLVEIFNACWPMYAAMPAVLKDAIEQAYIGKGWDMTSSVCIPRIFPTFADVMEALPASVSTAYSADTKGDYIGALGTRLKSMTNGINSQIFCSTVELSNKEIFDENAIVDLSRVGSSETKSLLMGILVLKLQEYRMSNADGENKGLQHITVLEEAHHLLRKTSSVQSQESSNLQGKSVEMIANAIAEMRTYGEGFIIADQAPGLMDESVIRNTNTKIILRLPDEADRQLVGKAAALNDFQITELSKLPQGVAAVYQNDWLEAVLCKVDLFEDKKKCEYKGSESISALPVYFQILFGFSDGEELSEEQVEQIRKWVNEQNVSTETRILCKRGLQGEELTEREQEIIAYNLFGGKSSAMTLENAETEKSGVERIEESLKAGYNLAPDLAKHITRILLRAIMDEAVTPKLCERYESYLIDGRIV
ncbi:MAG: DUF87 domain-containing protein [Lachnospiraceae bacterium]|nr:DUF87 domain-containing protein [Lachnospiraceae bacterium]